MSFLQFPPYYFSPHVRMSLDTPIMSSYISRKEDNLFEKFAQETIYEMVLPPHNIS